MINNKRNWKINHNTEKVNSDTKVDPSGDWVQQTIICKLLAKGSRWSQSYPVFFTTQNWVPEEVLITWRELNSGEKIFTWISLSFEMPTKKPWFCKNCKVPKRFKHQAAASIETIIRSWDRLQFDNFWIKNIKQNIFLLAKLYKQQTSKLSQVAQPKSQGHKKW